VIEALKREGFEAYPTHFSSRGIRTDAPASILKEILPDLVKQNIKQNRV
jgi:tRNA G26 N,N-dimethylase Trm1